MMMHKPAAIVLVLGTFLEFAGGAIAVEPTAKERAFRMGFTAFPHDISIEGVTAVKDFVRENGDIIALHFEGVPWMEAHTGKPFHPKFMEEWQRLKDAKPPGGKVYLALSPLNNGRSDIAGYRAEKENLPMPQPLAGKALESSK